MAESGFYALLFRMRNIARWGLMRNSYSENVQEHSHMVAVLAHALAVIGREVYGKALDPDKAAVAALFHDASEIFTGDLPTPIKYHSGELTAAYKQVERAAEEKLVSMLPEELRAAYAEVISVEDEEIKTIVKAADKLAAYIKCLEERKAGNGEFATAEKQTLKALQESELPEVSYFIEKFITSFLLTLDEQTYL